MPALAVLGLQNKFTGFNNATQIGKLLLHGFMHGKERSPDCIGGQNSKRAFFIHQGPDEVNHMRQVFKQLPDLSLGSTAIFGWV